MARPQKFRHQREELTDPKVAEKLGRFVIEIEDLREQRSKLDEMLAAAYDAVDDAGFEKKFVRKVVALRAKEEGARRDEEDGLETYEYAVTKGVSLARTRSKPAKEEFDPVTGEFLDDDHPASDETPIVPPSQAVREVEESAATHSHQAERETHDRDSQQHVGRTDDEQRNAPRVSRSVGRGEGADEGAQGQGAGASGSDRNGGPVSGTVDRQDEDGRSRHVGGEARHEITRSEDDAFAAVNPRVGLADANGVEPSSSAPIAPASQDEAEAPSAERVTPHRSGSAAANAGGDHVTAQTSSAATAGAAFSAAPVKKTIRDYRPHYLRPEACGSSKVDEHCYSCRKAMQEMEIA